MKTYESNKIGNANLNVEVAQLNNSFTDYQNAKTALAISREEVKQVAETVISTYSQRIADKINAKVPYIVRRNPIRQNGSRRGLQDHKATKVLAITERGVIFRVAVKMEGWYPMNVALELSHEQMAMSDADWKTYVGGYAGFIGKTYRNWVDPRKVTFEDSLKHIEAVHSGDNTQPSLPANAVIAIGVTSNEGTQSYDRMRD